MEEKDGVTRRWKRHRSRQAGWLAAAESTGLVLSLCSTFSSRVSCQSGQTVTTWEKESWILRLFRAMYDVLLEFYRPLLTFNGMTCVSIENSINCPLWNSTVRRRTSPGNLHLREEANP